MRVLLLGESGQVGYELKRSLSCLAEVIAPPQSQLDLTMSDEQLDSAIKQINPDLVVNAAAYTAVDRAEQESELAYQINAHAPGVMASACKTLNIPLIHFSTDYVFNGDAHSAWTEEAKPAPLNVYGQSKLNGEQAIQHSGVAHLILRTSWVYGNRGQNFLCTMKRLATEKEQLNIVDDQVGAPTWSRHLADAVSQIVAMSVEQGAEFWNTKTGVYHLTGGGQCTWYDFACAIFDAMRQAELTVPTVNPIKTEAYPTPASRPRFSVLDNAKIKDHLGIQLPDWRETLNLVMQDAGF
jgi:dTDP-4-dehydrorhamnose reductase